MQVVRILGANGEELQMLSTDYHNMDGHPVTIVPDDTGTWKLKAPTRCCGLSITWTNGQISAANTT